MQRGEAVTVEYVEVQKEYACLEGLDHSMRASVTPPGRKFEPGLKLEALNGEDTESFGARMSQSRPSRHGKVV